MTVFYCIEDQISRAVAERLIVEFCPAGTQPHELGEAFGGFGYIKKSLAKFHELARHFPVLIITDLDRAQCPPSLRASWLASAKISEPLPERMLFCIAQTEIESWILADSNGIASFLKVNLAKIVSNIEINIIDSKEYLVELAKSSSDPIIRSDLAPKNKSAAATGINYNHRISQFVREVWNPTEASHNSASLRRAIAKLTSLTV